MIIKRLRSEALRGNTSEYLGGRSVRLRAVKYVSPWGPGIPHSAGSRTAMHFKSDTHSVVWHTQLNTLTFPGSYAHLLACVRPTLPVS